MPEQLTTRIVAFRRFAKRTLAVLRLVLLVVEIVKRVLELL